MSDTFSKRFEGKVALIAGGEYQPAELIRERHQQIAADSRLQVLFGHVRFGAGERPSERRAVGCHQIFNWQLDQRDAEIVRKPLSVVAIYVGGKPRWHGDCGYRVWP